MRTKLVVTNCIGNVKEYFDVMHLCICSNYVTFETNNCKLVTLIKSDICKIYITFY